MDMTCIKNYCIVFLLLILVFPADAQDTTNAIQSRPKIGLVLTGGGARGFAHIGILKMLDSLNIPIDYIAGTSMGGIAGGLYAIGYSGIEIEKIARQANWDEIFSDQPAREVLPYLQKRNEGLFKLELGLKGVTPQPPSSLISGQKISLFISGLTIGYEQVEDFNQLPIPFRCVAVDLVTGNEVVLKRGSLAKALRATMSIPSVFSPVKWGDSLLVDGGIANNIPTDVVRRMGADYVITVDVGEPIRKRDQINNIIDIIDQTFNIMVAPGRERNLQLSDLTITPELKGYAPSDFEQEKIDQIIRRGEIAARNNLQECIRLKEKYNLNRTDIGVPISLLNRNPVVYGISITGNSVMPFKTIYEMCDIRPGDRFHFSQFEERMADLRLTGPFHSLNYKVRPVDSMHVRIIIDIDEKEPPRIHGISVEGNETLPFQFIYRLLGIDPGQSLQPELIHKRINELYGLGYFENITYEIEPHSKGWVHLTITVEEKTLRRLKLGFHYDNYYKLVGTIGAQANSIPFPGMRGNLVLQFAGIQRIKWRLSYPSRNLNTPLFPYARFLYKDLPVAIYDQKGSKIASYHDRSVLGAAGLTLLFGKVGAIDFEYAGEWMNIDPSIAFPDPETFPSWNEHIRQVGIYFNIDALDDVILPREGIKLEAAYETSKEVLGSDLNYSRIWAQYDEYFTLGSRHTLHLNGRYMWGSDSLIAYKQFYMGGPGSFVGMQYTQLGALHGFKTGLEYRYEHKKDIFLKLIVDYAHHLYDYEDYFNVADYYLGYGIGIKFTSIIGPFEFIFARGPRSFYKPVKYRNTFYFTAGLHLD
ncbi:MAG: BamA/TamA family outer membrane protein [Caldithrix sp.]|nr:BamA/TamA family outer membrane protein [Caldithrix sp.]